MRKRWLGVVAGLATMSAAVMMTTSGGLAALASPTGGSSARSVPPNAVSMMDCNGHSPKFKNVVQGLGGRCTDPVAIWANGEAYRFSDNGVYVGHDEPSVKFISSAPGSGNSMSYLMRLAVDPKAPPTVPVNGSARSRYGELSIAPWFGLPICDPQSYPQNSCTPDSDTNTGMGSPSDAGSAFMELQFYPPGFAPFVDSESCDGTRWCAALTIDSLECTYGFGSCNNDCIEPVNFAFLQTDGVPAGEPSPQLADLATFTPNRHTLMMNSGDVLSVGLRDSAQGLVASVFDLTTHQLGYMVASAQNGFMNTSIADCSGTPFSFHPEYDTAQQANEVPWAALEGGVLMQQELGHFEACQSVTNALPVDIAFGSGATFSDPQMAQTCLGGSEGPGSTVGEGPCDPLLGTCTGATTEGVQACPTNDAASGALCEFSDAACFPAGARTTLVNSVPEVVRWPIAGCLDNFFQNGDADFDGTPYIHDWPDGSPAHPTSFAYLGPFSRGAPYPQIQFETDVAGSEANCNTDTGVGCAVPPLGPGNQPAFYPFWSIGRSGLAGCVWNFGDVIPGRTVQSFGGSAQYGTPNLARYGGTLTSPVMANPLTTGSCRSASGP